MNVPQYEMLGNKPGNIKIRNIVWYFSFPFNHFVLVFSCHFNSVFKNISAPN